MSKSKGRRLAEWLRNLDSNSKASSDTIADDSISTAKLQTDAVTNPKIADGAVHTANLADANVTFAKLHTALVVTESDAIGSNDNDTTIATSAAIKDYVDTQVAGKDALSELSGDSDDITEGSSNLYFTNERVDDRVNSLLTAGTGITLTYDDAANTLTVAGAAQYGDSDVASYLSTNGYGTSSSIIASITDSAPTTLDTLNELAAALGDDANFSTTTATSLGNRLRIDTASQGLTGTQQTNALTNLGITATVAELNYVDGVTSNIQTQLDAKGTSSFSGSYNDLSNKPTIPTNNNQLTNGAGYITSFDITTQTDPKYLRSNVNDQMLAQLSGGFGAVGTGGTTNWNDSTNARSGGGYTLLTGNASNGPGGSTYYHPFSFEYSSKNGTGNMTQLAIPYNGFSIWHRYRYNNSWSGWVQGWNSANDGSGSGLDADLLDGVQGSSYLRSDVNDSMAGQLVIDNGEANPLELKRSSQVGIEFNDTSTGSRYLGVNSGNLYYGSNLNHANNNRVLTTGDEGSGNGLDADTVDGIQGSNILTLSGSQTITGTKTFSAASGNIFKLNDTNATNATNANIYFYFQANGSNLGYIGYGSASTNYLYINNPSAPVYLSGSSVLLRGGYEAWGADNDGSGSGLDADLLDGQQGSYYTDMANSSGQFTTISATSASSRDKIRVYPSSNYAIGMESGITYGHLNDWAMTFQMNDDTESDRGFWWGDAGHSTAQGAMSLTVNGRATIATSLSIGQGESITGPNSTTLYVGGNAYINGATYGGLSIGETPTNYDGWDTQLNVNGSGHSRINVKTANVRMGIYAHDSWQGGAMGHVGTYTNHQLSFICNATQRAVLTTAGSLSTDVQGTLWGASNDGSGSGLDADTLDGVQGSSYLRSDTSDTMSGSFTATGEVNAYSGAIDLRSDGIYFESGDHCITWNDGNGNFNIRVANNPSEICTEAGYVFQDEWSQSGGWREFNVSSASLAIGNSISWRPQIYYDYNEVSLRYQGSEKLATTSGGVDVTGDFTNSGDIQSKSQIRAQGWWNTATGNYGDAAVEIGMSGGNGYILCYNRNTSSYDDLIIQPLSLNLAPVSNGAVNIKGYTAWHAGNDGSGSGLDADTLDGVDSALYFKSYTNNNGGWSQSNRNFSVRTGGNAVGLHMEESDGTFGFQMYGNGSSYGFLASEWGAWDIKKTPSGNMTLNNSDSNIVWHAGNDGSGSGLDADTLDGIQGASFLRSDAGDTSTGLIEFQSGLGIHRQDGVYVTPTSKTKAVYWKFAESSQLNSPPGSGSWRHVATIQGWTQHSSSYPSWQMCFGNGAFGVRQSTSNSAWASWQTVWTSGNDGSGSGLDADTLDGYQGSNYIGLNGNSYYQLTNWLQSTGSHGFYSPSSGAGTHFYPGDLGNYGSFRVDGRKGSWSGISLEGRVVFMHNGSTASGIYNDVDNHWLFYGVNGDKTAMYHNGSEKIYTYASGGRVTGNLLATSNVYAYYSDERLKDKTGKIENALDKVDAIETFYYTHNDKANELGYEGKDPQVGVSAQSVEAVMPEVVHLAPIDDDGSGVSISGENYKTVQYEKLVPLLIEAIKEQQAQIKELKEIIKCQ